MNFSTKTLAAALFGLAFLSGAVARADDQHHQPDSAAAPPSVGAPDEQPAATPFPPMMMPMMNMMGQQSQGMPMMMMGQGGGMMGQGAMSMSGAMPNSGMAMQDMGAHLEGRLAFLRAELAITAAQTPQWEAFAQALRDSASKLKQAQAGAPQTSADSNVLRSMELRERWLTAHPEGLKSVEAAFAGLQAVLSDDQKKTVETLLTAPVCLGQMGMM
jgi:hypothetical protein